MQFGYRTGRGLGVREHLHRLAVARAAVPHARRQALDRLDVVRKDLQTRRRHRPNAVDVASQIRREDFY